MGERGQGVRGRRSVLAGAGAALAGGVLLGNADEAAAANGDPVRLGQINTATSNTRVNMSGNGVAVSVANTNTGSMAHGTVTTATTGYALSAVASRFHGAKTSTASPGHHGLMALNTATATGTGAALFAKHHSPSIGASGATAIRAVTADGEEALRSAPFWPGAAEFAGASDGVIGCSTVQGGAGVVGYNPQHGGYGVYGVAPQAIGVWAEGSIALWTKGQSHLHGHTTLYADLQVTGNVSKSGGSFRIDHPLDPANKYLSHSFVESPDMLNVYNGVVVADDHGAATVELPEWFEALNKDFRYQLTPIGGPAPDLHVSEKVVGNRFGIAGARAGQEISWQLTGVRHDAWANKHRIPVEHAKPTSERGRYLFPEGFGKSPEEGLAGQPPRTSGNGNHRSR